MTGPRVQTKMSTTCGAGFEACAFILTSERGSKIAWQKLSWRGWHWRDMLLLTIYVPKVLSEANKLGLAALFLEEHEG